MHNSSINMVATHRSLLFTNMIKRMPPCSMHVHQTKISYTVSSWSHNFSREHPALCPNHFCLTQVTHGEQKQKMHSSLSPSSSEAFPWPEWPTSTPALASMALAQFSPCLSVSGSTLTTVVSSVAKNGWTKLFLARNVLSKFRKGRDISWT